MATAWMECVKKAYADGKKRKGGSYSFKNALKDAKKLYKKSMKNAKSMMKMGKNKKNKTRRGGQPEVLETEN